MAKRKSKNAPIIVEDFIDLPFRTNTLRVFPFPPGMYDGIISEVLVEHPDPTPPVIPVKSFAGSEEKPETIEDIDDPEYLKKKDDITKIRENDLAERVLGFVLDECLDVIDVTKMEADIKRLSKYLSYPEDKVERVTKYISTYVLRSKADFSKIITTSLKLTATGNKEVAEKLDSFQNRIQQGDTDFSSSSGTEGEK